MIAMKTNGCLQIVPRTHDLPHALPDRSGHDAEL